MNRRIGAVTIGQSPRSDVTPELMTFLGPGVSVVESGALDGFSRSELVELGTRTTGRLLVTRLRDGSEITLGHEFILPRVQECIRRLADDVDLVLLLCTGTFPRLASKKLVLYPEQLLFEVVRGIGATRIGVITPAAGQIPEQESRWSQVVREPFVKAASPYGEPAEFRNTAEMFARRSLDLVVLDCIGYTQAMKSEVQARVRTPVLLARSVLGRVAAELL
jgi:protein AroM